MEFISHYSYCSRYHWPTSFLFPAKKSTIKKLATFFRLILERLDSYSNVRAHLKHPTLRILSIALLWVLLLLMTVMFMSVYRSWDENEENEENEHNFSNKIHVKVPIFGMRYKQGMLRMIVLYMINMLLLFSTNKK